MFLDHRACLPKRLNCFKLPIAATTSNLSLLQIPNGNQGSLTLRYSPFIGQLFDENKFVLRMAA